MIISRSIHVVADFINSFILFYAWITVSWHFRILEEYENISSRVQEFDSLQSTSCSFSCLKFSHSMTLGSVIIPLTAGKLRLRPFKEVPPNHLGFSAWKADAFPTVQSCCKGFRIKTGNLQVYGRNTDPSSLLEVSPKSENPSHIVKKNSWR